VLDKKCDDFKNYLKAAGVHTLYDTNDLLPRQSVRDFVGNIARTEFVIVFTPTYKERYQLEGSRVSSEVDIIAERLDSVVTRYWPRAQYT
jgi:hypothetical protein